MQAKVVQAGGMEKRVGRFFHLRASSSPPAALLAPPRRLFFLRRHFFRRNPGKRRKILTHEKERVRGKDAVFAAFFIRNVTKRNISSHVFLIS
jgi:hypothetical protein